MKSVTDHACITTALSSADLYIGAPDEIGTEGGVKVQSLTHWTLILYQGVGGRSKSAALGGAA
jgi:hypothetical protein